MFGIEVTDTVKELTYPILALLTISVSDTSIQTANPYSSRTKNSGHLFAGSLIGKG